MESNITYGQMREAGDYVLSYWKFSGQSINTLDYSNKPRNLPEDVSKAWDVHNKYWAQLEERGIEI